ncbi:MAG: MBL fold metallo-hydrolase [Clostridia bacterium]|nr:MBL fold metallo-hydrolase [Clostridia bacterium]
MAKRISKKAKKYVKQNYKSIATFLAVVILILALTILITYLIKPQIIINLFNAVEREYYNYVKNYYYDSEDDDPSGINGETVSPIPEGELAEITGADLSIHFLELGNKYTGDCTLIKVGENTEVLIDAGSRKSSATTITSYVQQYCTDGVLEYVIATHAHQDHIAGFVGNNSGNSKTGVLYQFKVQTLIQFSLHNTNSVIYNEYVSAVEYLKTQGTTVYDAKECWYEQNGAKKSYVLDEAGNISLNLLYNYYYENQTDDENDYSVCTLLTQKIGGVENNYLFTGDLEKKGEEYLVKNNNLPECVLYKGGHHGSKTSSTDGLLSRIKPKYVAVCCCAGATEYTDNNQNTFPTQAFIDRVSKYTDKIYVTTLCTDYDKGEYQSMNGNIVFYYGKKESEDEASLKLWCSNNTTILKDTDWFKNNRTWGG